MNAYELADKLDTKGSSFQEVEAANMLRQQADRIAELEKSLTNIEFNEVMRLDSNMNLVFPKTKLSDDDIDALAWKIVRAGGLSTANSDINVFALQEDIKEMLKPKPLTDEETEVIWKKAMDDWTKVDDKTAKLSNQPFVFFCKAIEERHGIK